MAKDGTILAGHGTIEAAKSIGLKQAPVIRLDIQPMDPAALKVLTGDNQIANLGVIDDRSLAELLKEIQSVDIEGLLGTGYDERMLANLVFISRPSNEIESMDRALEWAGAGMPEHKLTDEPDCKLVVGFRNQEDRAKFLELIGVERVTGISLWWPAKPRNDNASVAFEKS